MRLDTPRIPLVDPADFDDELKETFGGRDGAASTLPNIFRTLANHPKLASRWFVFGNHILSQSTLPPRDREILILRIGWLCQSEYEWAQHVRIGKRAGLDEGDIAGIKAGPDVDGWTAHERCLVQAADELRGDAFLADATWAGLAESYTQEQMMDLVFTCGQYMLVSMALNSFGVQLDDGLEGF